MNHTDKNTIQTETTKQVNDAASKSSEWQSTYHTLVSDRNCAGSSNMKVNAVLTIDKYLHL
jgi:hypothetical protein